MHTSTNWVIRVKLPVVADQRVEKFKILKKVVKKLEKDGINEVLARNEIKPVDEAITMLKIILASAFFRLDCLTSLKS